MATLPALSRTDFPAKVNTKNGVAQATPLPGLDTSKYYDADEFNRLSGAVIDNRAAISALEDDNGTSAISDTDGDTRVDTEATPDGDTITLTAGGEQVGSFAADESTVKTPANLVGQSASMGVASGLYVGVNPGFFMTAGADGVSPAAGPSPAMVYGYATDNNVDSEGGGVVLGSSTVRSIGGERPESILSASSGVSSGTASATMTVGAKFGSSAVSGAKASVLSSGASNLAFYANGSAETAFNDPAAVDLPLGYASLMAAIVDLAGRRETEWPATFAADSNVDSVTLLSATQRTEGDRVTLRGSLAINTTASGLASVTATLPTTEDGTGAAGPASCVSDGLGITTTAAALIESPTQLAIVFDAVDAGAHLVGFSITYKAA